MNLKQFKSTSDKVLHTYVKKKIRESQKIASWEHPSAILEYIDTIIFAGGKRIRPYLIYLSYKLFGGVQDDDVIRFSTSAELIHSFALIHDDIIDKGDMRHGVLCVHKYVANALGTQNKDHLGISQAILVGDLVYAWAYDVLYDTYSLPPAKLRAAQKNMQAMIEEVVAGQMLDVDAMSGTHVDMQKLEEKSHYKSGQYTFTRPLITGALLAGIDKKSITLLEKIGALLGKAYQLRDDILDVTVIQGDDTSTYDNKTKFSDIQDGQQTFLTQYIHDFGSYTHRLAISKAMGKRLSESQIKELRDVFVQSNAIEYGVRTLHQYLQEARELLKKLKVTTEEYLQYLYDILDLLQKI